MNCPKCNNTNYIKAGIISAKQRYLCKPCNYYYTIVPRDDTARTQQRRQALDLYLEGLGFRSIGRIMKVSHVAVYNWIKGFGSRVQELNSDEIVPVVELDEMHTYIKSKKTAAGSGLPSTE